MTEYTKEELDRMVDSLAGLVTDKTIEPNTYYKLLLTVAYKYLKEHNDVTEAYIILLMIPPEYYQNVLNGHMKEDPALHAETSFIVQYIKTHGLADIEDIRPNMHPAKA